jgi:exonuclease SbcC
VTKKGESALAGAKKAASKARDASSKAASAHAAAQAAVKGLEEQAAELTSELKDHPDPDAITATLTSIKEAEVALEDKQAFESQVRRDLEDARAALGTARDQENAARTAFESARDGLVPLEPPPAAREDLAADWDRLIGWAKTRQSALAKETKDAEKAVNAGRVKLAKLNDALEAACTGCGLEVGRGSVVEAAVTAHTQAIESVKQIEKAIADATKMRRQLKGARLEQATNHELANHLSAKAGMFESWIVGAALERLVQGAGEILRELSDDQYSLRIDDKGSFLVTDRHNADETRSARTLSGGETFLASLALALALADQLADLATEGAAHLDAIFLDEGFGTLDDQTLRTVADTVEKLASSGRMVGVVTHVKELADSVPLHFRVKKDSGGSTVERIAM